MLHHNIESFAKMARTLDEQGSRWNLADAFSELAAWMDLARYKLTDEDVIVLTQIGGTIYREVSRAKEGQSGIHPPRKG